ncbi:MAG: hypothetical protein VR69_12020 [Peptococcaceae bacterium BRH_c4b]|nr:MAG: hypothetical protein VR69_12020 [Peptococcaceae bacterium BRH_c4b]
MQNFIQGNKLGIVDASYYFLPGHPGSNLLNNLELSKYSNLLLIYTRGKAFNGLCLSRFHKTS